MARRSSGLGERTARKGLRYQDRASAALAYQALVEGTLSFIALADDQAGMFDDLVIGIAGKVVGHQYKSSSKPKPVGVRGKTGIGGQFRKSRRRAKFSELLVVSDREHE